MPLINGQKMACLPCIRGHRSTKCTHASERLMVPVRKPGRPLSTCPHPPTRSCSCSVVTAAIPRRQTCHCGPTSENLEPTPVPVPAPVSLAADADPNMPAVPIKTESETSSTTSSPSITGRPSTAYRVQKTGAKNSSRKQSIDPTNLDKLDRSQVNILPGPFNGSLGQQKPIPQLPLDTSAAFDFTQPPPMTHAATGHVFSEALMYQSFTAQFTPLDPPPPKPTPAPASTSGHVPITLPGNTGHLGMDNGTTSAPPSVLNGTNGVSSCCSSSKDITTKQRSASVPTPAHQLPPVLTERKNPGGGGSCCSSKIKPPDVKPNLSILPPVNIPHAPSSSSPATNGMLMSPFQQSMPSLQDMYNPYYSPPTIFTYPPSYGSFLQPLQPEQWRQIMENISFNQAPPAPAPTPVATQHQHQHQHHRQNSFNQMPQSMSFGAIGSTTTPAAPQLPSPNTSSQAGTTHECSCGTSCQCIGCAAHPYNEATKAYVRSAWTSMLEEQDHASVESIKTDSMSNSLHAGASTTTPTQLHHPTTTAMDGAGSPTAPHTPSSDATSGIGEEQNYSANDFFFVTYPFDSCGGEEESCPCGDDCQCFGCTIHGNNSSQGLGSMLNGPSTLRAETSLGNGIINGMGSGSAPLASPSGSGAGPGGGGGVGAKGSCCG